MIYPLKDKKYITQRFGENPKIYARFGMQGHNGIDFRVKYADTPKGWRYCYAVKDGKVTEVINQGKSGYGLYIRLRHEGTEQTLYGHLKRSYVRVGYKVKSGDKIGLTDNTGFSTGAHLHFGWRPNRFNYNNGFKGYEDPLPLLEGVDSEKEKLKSDNEALKMMLDSQAPKVEVLNKIVKLLKEEKII